MKAIIIALAMLQFNVACMVNNQPEDFSITKFNPDSMVDPALFGYSQVVTVNNGKMIFLACPHWCYPVQ